MQPTSPNAFPTNTHNKNKNKNKTTHDTPIAVFDAIPETTTAKTQAGFPTNSKIRCDSSQIACVMNRFPSSTLPIRFAQFHTSLSSPRFHFRGYLRNRAVLRFFSERTVQREIAALFEFVSIDNLFGSVSLLAELRRNQIHEVDGDVADVSQRALQSVRNQKTLFAHAADEVFEVLDKRIDCVVAGKLGFEFGGCWNDYIGG